MTVDYQKRKSFVRVSDVQSCTKRGRKCWIIDLLKKNIGNKRSRTLICPSVCLYFCLLLSCYLSFYFPSVSFSFSLPLFALRIKGGKYLAVGSHDRSIIVYSVFTSKRVAACHGASSTVQHLDWSTDGQVEILKMMMIWLGKSTHL